MPGLESTPEMNDLRMSEGARPLFDQVKRFIDEEVEPVTAEFFRLGEDREDPWSFPPAQLELLDGLKAKAKSQGLWNFFLPDAESGEGLKNLDYAYIAAELGKNPIASECLNCSAPDTGNMEVLERVGTPASVGSSPCWPERSALPTPCQSRIWPRRTPRTSRAARSWTDRSGSSTERSSTSPAQGTHAARS